nr:albino or Glassy Yellow 1 [Tanacetum cinerariifolium]
QPNLDVSRKEAIFEQIDALEKQRNKDLEAALTDALPQAFAIVKETARRYAQNGQLVVTATDVDRDIARVKGNVTIQGDKATWSNKWLAAGAEITWDMVHYDVQLIGGVVLHQGKIAEMATGEGKTLVSTLPAFLNALGGRGVHLVTVNDYLAKRDSEWNAPLFEFHGLTLKPRIQRLVDEQKKLVQSYLVQARKAIAEGKTGATEGGKDGDGGLALFRAYRGLPKSKPLIKFLSESGMRVILQQGEDPHLFIMPDIGVEIANIEKAEALTAEEKLQQKEQLMSDYQEKSERVHTVNQLLKAYTLFEKDDQYILSQDGKVMIVDEQTGRVMEGR